MAQYRLNAYDADVYIPEFKGLMQYGDQMGTDLRFSPDCLNVETPAGVLQPAAKFPPLTLKYNSSELFSVGSGRQITMMYALMKNITTQPISSAAITLTDEDHTGGSTLSWSIIPDSEYYLYIFAIGTKLYKAVLPVSINDFFTIQRTNFYNLLFIPTGGYLEVSQLSGTYASSKWSWCTYEMDFSSGGGLGPNGRTNILVMSNPTNGVYYAWDANGVTAVTTPSKFSHIARYADRIWGVGTGDEKDSIFYSRAYNVTDWTGAGSGEDPADGGGEIREPTFDEDKFVALTPFGDSLIAFTQERAWRITGSDPSNFYIQEQYGNGTKYPESIAVVGDYIIMLGNKGLVSYDGTRVSPFMQECTHEIFRRIDYLPAGTVYNRNFQNRNKEQRPCAVYVNGKYVLGLANKIAYDNDIPGYYSDGGYFFIVYDSTDQSVVMEDRPEIMDFCAESNDIAYAVTHEVDTDVAKASYSVSPLMFDSWDTKRVTSKASKWVTPWIDLGRKDIQKGGFELYFYPELNTDDTTDTVTLKFSMQTEKKTKSKSYVVHALTADERTAGKLHKQKRLHFGGAGRRFRLTIEVEAGNTVPWRLIGGIHIIAETDKD